MKKYIALLFMSVIFFGCNFSGKEKPAADSNDDNVNVDLTETHDSLKTQTNTVVLSELNKDSVLLDLTKKILTVFKMQQYGKLDSFIHPTEGVRFSPYATVDISDKKFSKENFNTLITNGKNKKINWGNYDGSGDPILLTPSEYFKKFVYDVDFLRTAKSGVNRIYKEGNSVNNMTSFYEGYDFTENYFSGGKKSNGMNWRSVRFVFKEIDGKYYLVGVIHDQWTI
jgi:hypothetical protein